MHVLPPTSSRPPGHAQRDDEIFDVVDEHDAVIGQATRREVHARGLWHRAVHVLVFSVDGRVFLQKRSMAKDTAPGCWDSSCSGHLDAGEDYAAAAVRELREEIGLAVAGPEALTPLFKTRASAETGWEFVWIYRMQSDAPLTLNPAEIERGEWWLLGDVSRGINERPGEFARAFRFLWAKAVADGLV
jgi:isopentenyl-diphosphate Delta-isomerase